MKHSVRTLLACLIALLLVLAVFCHLRLLETGCLPLSVLSDFIFFLLICVIVLAAFLQKSLHKTLYSYTNIVLIGVILFDCVFIAANAVLLGKFLKSGDLSLSHIFRVFLEFPRQFSYYAVFVIFAVCVLLAVSNVALIRHEGFCLQNALSLVIAGFYVGGTVLVYLISDLLKQYVFTPQGIGARPVFLILRTMIPFFLLLLLCYLECVFASAALLGFLAARKKPAYDKDCIIILGCSIDKRGGLLPLLKGRVNRAIRFAWEQEIATGKSVKYVPSGGQGPNEIMSEGSAMELYLLAKGAESDEVFPEKASRNTLENFRLSKKIIDENLPGAKIAFATTNYHILRSGILAREAGFDAEGIAGDTKWYFWPNGFIREFFGILALKKRAHVTVAAILAVFCIVVGCVGALGNLL